MKYLLSIAFSVLLLTAAAQTKKPLDHSVYDGWKSIGEKMISNDGKYIVYAINPQEGDGNLVIQNVDGSYRKIISRGYSASITEDSRFVIFKIKPVFQETRQAKIKKKKADELTKDSLGIIELGTDSVRKIARVKSFKTPEKAAGWAAYQLEKPLADSTKRKALPDSMRKNMDLLARLADSIIHKSIDSIKGKITKEAIVEIAEKAAKAVYKKAKDDVVTDAEGDDATNASAGEGSDLVLQNTATGKETVYKFVSEYFFNRFGTKLLVETTKKPKDTNSVAYLLLVDLQSNKTDTIMTRFNDCKSFSLNEDGNQVAFVAERDSAEKALQKFYKLWYYKTGQDSAIRLADKSTTGMQLGYTVSENATVNFSKDGKKLFFGIAPVRAPKDTTLVDFELARLDIWNYQDDYLQPQQLKQLDAELKRSFLAVVIPGDSTIVQLGATDAETTVQIDQGNAGLVLATSTKGNRIQEQWTGRDILTSWIINTTDGKRTLIKKDAPVFMVPSPKGRFVFWYDPILRHYFTYEVATGTIRNITSAIKVPLYDTENDVPDYPENIGNVGWMENDQYFFIQDEFDIWQVDPLAKELPKNITNGWGRKNKTRFDYIRLDNEKRFFLPGDTALFKSFNKETKYAGFVTKKMSEVADPTVITTGPFTYTSVIKAKYATRYITQQADISKSELYTSTNLSTLERLTQVDSQQVNYNWLTTELVKWKMFDGRMSEGLLYKPANFDPKKKYPVIFYFYERNTDGLYNYRLPSPSASTVNIPYFVSNEYLIFDPNIYYKAGEPGQSAYNSVVSAAKYLSKMPWVDSTRMAIQGQSWGGYQVAYLITKTNIFKAAGAGAPVANMTSAYGGIRWGSGLNRQFQYEKTQSRIGATLWQRPDLYIKNSPLFSADKVNTPLLIMHNDADDAVPWYQGIEYFTALKRLGKKVWMLQYNNEAHNLKERKNRKDLSIRLSQFFDYYLKDAKPPTWLKEGLPATEKGKSWGL